MDTFISEYLCELEEDANRSRWLSGTADTDGKNPQNNDFAFLDSIKTTALSDNVVEFTFPRSSTGQLTQGQHFEQIIALEKENLALLDLATKLSSESMEDLKNSEVGLPTSNSNPCIEFSFSPHDDLHELRSSARVQNKKSIGRSLCVRKINRANNIHLDATGCLIGQPDLPSPEIISCTDNELNITAPVNSFHRKIMLPVKLWIKIPFNDLTRKLCLKLKHKLQQSHAKSSRKKKMGANSFYSVHKKRLTQEASHQEIQTQKVLQLSPPDNYVENESEMANKPKKKWRKKNKLHVNVPRLHMGPDMNIGGMMLKQIKRHAWKVSCLKNNTSNNDLEIKGCGSITSQQSHEPLKAKLKCDGKVVENREIMKVTLKRQLCHVRRQKRQSKLSRFKGTDSNEQIAHFNPENDVESDISCEFCSAKQNAANTTKRKGKCYVHRYKRNKDSSIKLKNQEEKTPTVPRLSRSSKSKYHLRQPLGKRVSYDNYMQSNNNKNCVACFDHEKLSIWSGQGCRSDHVSNMENTKGVNFETHESKNSHSKQWAEEYVKLKTKHHVEIKEILTPENDILRAEDNSDNYMVDKPVPDDSGIGVDDDFSSNLTCSETEGNSFIDSFIYHLDQEEARSSKQLELVSAGDENAYHSTKLGETSDNGKEGSVPDSKSFLDFPSVFDERDCLSIFDDFDFNVDSDLFEIENRKADNSCSSPLHVARECTSYVSDSRSTDFRTHRAPKNAAHSSEKKEEITNSKENKCISNEIELVFWEKQVPEKLRWTSLDLGDVSDTHDAVSHSASQVYCEPPWQAYPSDDIQKVLDADPSIPKTLLAPTGFCFHYLKDGKCPFHSRCRFKHAKPSDAELYKHLVITIKIKLQTGNFSWAILTYRQLCESFSDQLLPAPVLSNLLFASMDSFRIPDMFFILYKIKRQNLFDKLICNKAIRLCWPQHMTYKVDLEKIFFTYMSLNITLDLDCVLYMLHLFYATRNPVLLWELVCTLSKYGGFVVPAYIMEYALICVAENPQKEVIIKFEQWVCTAQPLSLTHMKRNVLSHLSSELCQVVPHCASAFKQLLGRSNKMKERTVKETVAECKHIPVEKMKNSEQEEYKSFLHKINHCASCLDWPCLGEIFIELCREKVPNNHHFVSCYVLALDDAENPGVTVCNCKRFLSTVIHEKNVNVFVTLDANSLSQIFSQLVITLFKRGQVYAAAEIVEMVIEEKHLFFVGCSPNDEGNAHHPSIPGVVLSSLKACISSRRFELGLFIVEENLCYLHRLSFQWKQQLIVTCLEDLIENVLTSPYKCVKLQLLKQLLTTCSTLKNSVASKLCKIITLVMDHGDMTSAADLLHFLIRQPGMCNISPLLVRKFLCGCVVTGTDLSPDILSHCIRCVDYPHQVFTNMPQRQLYLQLGMTMSEIKLIIDHYLTILYSYLCDFVDQGQRLSMADMHLSVHLMPGTVESLDVTFLGSAPRTMDILQEVIISAFKTLVPSIQAKISNSDGIIYVEPQDLANFLQQMDIKDGRPKLWIQLQDLIVNSFI